ncbi:DUF1479-domain-containing protein [Whalleya microplaca]|nr:DUF1479-domain-containing protein [Whalleya microplaca]
MADQSLLPTNISVSQFKQLLGQYKHLIESLSSAKGAKPGQQTLLELDKFRYDEAVTAFQSEDPKQQMKHDDVKMLVDWKLRHGKFRPTLMKLVSSNDQTFVEQTIQNAMKEYWVNPDTPRALDTVTKLKGVGPATASLLLSVHDPDRVIFFSDEAFYWLCCDGQKSPIKYNAKEYQELNAAAQALVKRLEVSALDIEKVAYVLMREGAPQTVRTNGQQALSSPASGVKPTNAGSTQTSTKRKSKISEDLDFLSPSHASPLPLSDRFAKIKRDLIAGNEQAVISSFHRLLAQLRAETDRLANTGPANIIPSIDYFDIHDPALAAPFAAALRTRGIAIVRRVVPPNVARAWADETRDYLRHNPNPNPNPCCAPQTPRYELFWSPAQVRARADSRVLEAQRFAMAETWHVRPSSNSKGSEGGGALVSPERPVAYADRFQMRTRGPGTRVGEGKGDRGAEVGAHVDGGSVERWEPDGYGRAGTYAEVFAGRWEAYDPWDSRARLGVTSDLYNGVGACSMFRMFQGWLALSPVTAATTTTTTNDNNNSGGGGGGGGGGGLLACPMLQLTTAYILLRPFFRPLRGEKACASTAEFLGPANWVLASPQDTVLHGAVPGSVQELSDTMHPHLRLGTSMVPVPALQAGDYVLWHPDAVHAANTSAEAVLYVPACPLSLTNALYLARQRRAFLLGRPAPDFAGVGRGEREGERGYVGRPGVQEVADAGGEEGLRAMGLLPWDERGGASRAEERELLRLANAILFPDRFDVMCRRGAKRL